MHKIKEKKENQIHLGLLYAINIRGQNKSTFEHHIKNVVSVVSIALFLSRNHLQTLQRGTKEKTATTDGHNYNKYDRNQSLVTTLLSPE